MHLALQSALTLAAFVAAAQSSAFADRTEATVALNGSAAGSVTAAGDVATVGFLVSEGAAKKLSFSVTRAKGSTLAPDVRLIAPNGSIFDPVASGGPGSSVKPGPTSWSAKVANVPAGLGGLWKIEIRGANGSSGGFSCTVKGKDVAKVTEKEHVVPNGASFDVPIDVGADSTITVTAKRVGVATLTPRIQIVDPNGALLENGGFLGASNEKSKSFALKAYRLPTFGRYRLRFSGVNAAGGSITYTATTAAAKIKGAVPTADAGGPGADSDPGMQVTLNGTRSAATGGGPLTFAWVQTAGAPVVLSNPTQSSPTFTAPSTAGTLAFALTVSEGAVRSKTASVVYEIGAAPLADAGRSQRVAVGAPVTLRGTGSVDRRGSGLRHVWRQDDSDTLRVTLFDASAASPTFTAPNTAGVLRFHLRVDDGSVRSAEDMVVVAVGDPRPVADAGRQQVVSRMATVHLSGLATELPSGLLDGPVAWTQVSGPSVTLSDAASPFPAFTAPKTNADLTFECVAGGDAATKDRVVVKVRSVEDNGAPTTLGNGPHLFGTGSVALGVSTSSDPDTDALAVRWAQVAGPALATSAAESPTPSVTLPGASGIRSYVTMTNDGLAYGPPDAVHVRTTGYSGLPLAHAGSDRTASPGNVVGLTALSSGRTQGSGALTYRWRQLAGKDWFDVDAQSLTFDPAAASPTFTVPTDLSSLTSRRILTFELVVNDGTADSAPDYVTIVFAGLPLNGKPQVTSAVPTSATPLAGATVTINATVNDRDGDPVTVRWSQTAGPAVTLSSTTSLSPSFTAPADGLLSFRIIANDGFEDGPAVNVPVDVNAAPTARPVASPSNGPAGTLVTMNGATSSDPEGTPLTYLWTQTGGPAVTFDAAASSFQFTSTSASVTFLLVVSDGAQSSPATSVGFSVGTPVTISPSATRSSAPYGTSMGLSANSSGTGPITYAWRQIRVGATANDPVVGLSSTTAINPTFTVPAPSTSTGPFGAAPAATFGLIATGPTNTTAEQTVVVTFYASYSDPLGLTTAGNTVTGVLGSGTCTSCHFGSSNSCPVGSGGNASGYGLAGSASSMHGNTVGAAACKTVSGNATRVVSGSPSTSVLLLRLKGTGGSMPPGSAISAAQIALIEDWISQGASSSN